MVSQYDKQYHLVPFAACGTMICAACNKPITEGEFRAYKKNVAFDWKFVTHHRGCCSNDPMWQQRDRDNEHAKKRAQDLLAAAQEFRAQWGIYDLDELIDDLRASAARALEGAGR